MEKPSIKGFDFIRCLGQGGMASVWEARQHDPDRIVAVKILLDDISSRPKDVEAFYSEAKTAGLLDHPNIVTVFEVGCQKNHYYYVMELAAGYDTSRWLSRKGKLEESDVLTVAESVAVALDYAYETINIIHCDIKPANIVVDSDGTVRITDMGIARFAYSATDEECVSGTPSYMSPEQAMGNEDLDFRADIYSLGATIYHLLSGRALFAGKGENEILQSQLNDTVPDIRLLNPAVTKPCAVMLSRFLAKNRDFRPQSWAEAISMIRDVLAYDENASLQPDNSLNGFSRPSTMPLSDGQEQPSACRFTLENREDVPLAKPMKGFWIAVAIASVAAFILGLSAAKLLFM